MDNLKRMLIFYHVADLASFSAAARRLGMAKSAVSKQVSLLEQSIGIRLLNRNTRSLSLTEDGENYLHSCTKLLEVYEQANAYVSNIQEQPCGSLKISSPTTLGVGFVSRILHEFLQLYPHIKAELLLDENLIDLTEQGVDVAIRVGWMPDSSLRAKKLRDAPRILCASADYFKHQSLPKTPADLMMQEWIIFTRLPTPQQVTFSKNGRTQSISIKGRIKTNNAGAVHRFLLAGAGIAALSDFVVLKDIQQGKLIHLLPDYHLSDAGIYAVYQDNRIQQSKIRLFIDFLAARFNQQV